MDLFFSQNVKLQESFSSRARTSNSKRGGIKVTLSKQKSSRRSKNENDVQKQNTHDFLAHSIQSVNESSLKKSHPTESEYKRSHETQSVQFRDNNSVQSDLISSFFQKSQQKEWARKESAALDEQIRKLQLQIYNTRSKITEAKYLAKKQSEMKEIQTIKNSRKSKQKGKVNEIQIKSNKSLKNQNPSSTLKISQKYVQQQTPQSSNNLNCKSPIQVIQNISPTKIFRSSDRSRSPSPPHPSILREILMEKKKSSANYSNLGKHPNPFYQSEISFPENQTIHRSQLSKNMVDDINEVSKQKVLAQVNQQKMHESKEKFLNSLGQKSVKEKRKQSRKVNNTSTKKRSTSAFLIHQATKHLDKTKDQDKNLLRLSAQAKKRKPKVSDFNLDLYTIPKKDKADHLNLSDFNAKKDQANSKNKLPKKTVFTNQLVTKSQSTVINKRKSKYSLRKGI